MIITSASKYLKSYFSASSLQAIFKWRDNPVFSLFNCYINNNLFKQSKKSGFALIELLIVILIIWFLASLSMERIPSSHPYKISKKTCFSNQRFLSGAIDMYNMDNYDNMLDKAFPGYEFEEFHKLLIRKNYLKENTINTRIKDCSYGFVDYGNVFCVIHGSKETDINEETIYPIIEQREGNSSYYEQYNNLRLEMAKKSKKFKNSFCIADLFSDSSIPGLLLAITFVFISIAWLIGLKKPKQSDSQQ